MSQPERRESEEKLLEKIRIIAPERIAEVGDFVDLLHQRDAARRLTESAAKVSDAAFARA